MMVIADSEKPLVVAGVMGSVDAEVDEKTTDLVLESAWFHRAKSGRPPANSVFTRTVRNGFPEMWTLKAWTMRLSEQLI